MLPHERFELRDHVRMPAERELRVVQLLEIAARDRALEALAVELGLLDAEEIALRFRDEPVSELAPEGRDRVADLRG
jgi:hypothetical protein